MSDSCQKCACHHHAPTVVPVVQQTAPVVAAQQPAPAQATAVGSIATPAQHAIVVDNGEAAACPGSVTPEVNPIVEKPVPVTAAPPTAPHDAAHAAENTACKSKPATRAGKAPTPRKTCKTATLRDFVESLRRRNPADAVANAELVSCSNVWFRACSQSTKRISQHDYMRRLIFIDQLTSEHLTSCNMISLRGDLSCPVHILLAKLEPLVESYGHLLFAHNDKRVTLNTLGDVESIEYTLVPSFDNRLFKESDEVAEDLAAHAVQLNALCNTVLSKYGDGPISVEGVYADLVEQAPNDWVTEVVLIERTLVPMTHFAVRFKRGIPAGTFNALFRTRSPVGLGDYVDIGDGLKLATSMAVGKQVFLHVPRNERMTMEMLDMISDDIVTRVTSLAAMLDKQSKITTASQ